MTKEKEEKKNYTRKKNLMTIMMSKQEIEYLNVRLFFYTINSRIQKSKAKEENKKNT